MPTSSTPAQPHLLAGECYCSVWLTAAVLLALPAAELLPHVVFENHLTVLAFLMLQVMHVLSVTIAGMSASVCMF